MELHLRSNNSELYVGADNGNLYLSVMDSNSQRLNYTFCLSEEDLALINAYFQAHKAANKPDDKSEEKKDEQKSAWSEEDEMRIKRLCDFVWANRKGDTDEISQQEKDVYWLKSLIPQNTEKPQGKSALEAINEKPVDNANK